MPLVTGEAAITAATHHVAHRVVLRQIERLQSGSGAGRTPSTTPAAEHWKTIPSIPRTVSHSALCFLPQHPRLVMRRSKYPTEREPKGHGLTRSADLLQSHSQIAWPNCCSFMERNPNNHNFGTGKFQKRPKGLICSSAPISAGG